MVSLNGVNEVKEQYVVKQNENAEQPENSTTVKMTTSEPEPYGEKTNFGNTTQKVAVKANSLDYSNFGGKAKAQDAASYASNIIDTVNDALKNLQKNYPGANVDLEPFPNPQEFSKKQFGKDGAYTQWKEEVRAWRENSMTAINTYADKSHAKVTNDAADRITGVVIATYADLKGGQKQVVDQLIGLGQLTAEGFNQLMQKMDYDTDKVIRYVRQAANNIIKNDNRNAGAIISTVNQRTAELHEHMDYNDTLLSSQIFNTAVTLYNQAEGNKVQIKDHITTKADEINANTDVKVKQNQEFDAAGKRLQNNLSNAYVVHEQATTNRMMSMYEILGKSNIPHDEKIKLADKVADRAKDLYISDSEMKTLEDEINMTIKVYENIQNE